MPLLIAALLACADPAAPAERLLHTVESGHGARARFYGQPVVDEESTIPFPLEFGVERLCFELPGEDGCVPFEPWGTLHLSDWRFEGVFSPDGHWALLQQDRFCPYTVVLSIEHILRVRSPPATPERPPRLVCGAQRRKDPKTKRPKDTSTCAFAPLRLCAPFITLRVAAEGHGGDPRPRLGPPRPE